jgi:Family of unknown function (DUF6188)
MTLGDDAPVAPDRTPIEEDTQWRLPFEGMRVWSVALDVGLELQLDEKRSGTQTMIRIRLSGPLLCGPESSPSLMDPGVADRAQLGPALNLFYATVGQAIASKSGRLELRFIGGRPVFPVDGWVLRADPDTKYEAWQIDGPRRPSRPLSPWITRLQTPRSLTAQSSWPHRWRRCAHPHSAPPDDDLQRSRAVLP